MPYAPLQTLVSRDSGKTWANSGARMLDRELKFILDSGDELWIAGEGYFEGPTHNPFLLRFKEGADWQQFDVYEGDSELLAVAADKRNKDKFYAWVQHIDISNTENIHGPTFLHQSRDRGRTWEAVKQVKSVPKSSGGLRFFQILPKQSGRWRISENSGRNSSVEHLENDGQWHEVSTLPLVIQTNCQN